MRERARRLHKPASGDTGNRPKLFGMKNISLLTIAAIGLFLAGCSSKPPAPAATETSKAAAEAPAPPAAPTHAVVGEVQEVEPQGGSLTVRTANGEVHRVEVASHTEVKGLKEGVLEAGKGAEGMAKALGSDIKRGTMVVVKYSEKEGKLVAHEVKHASKVVVKHSEVVIHKVEDGGQKVIAKTKDGAQHTYEVSKDATVTTSKKIAEAGSAAGTKIEEGAKATVHFTEDAGKKVAHFVSH